MRKETIKKEKAEPKMCPVCNSNDILSHGVTAPYSPAIKFLYHCRNCKHKYVKEVTTLEDLVEYKKILNKQGRNEEAKPFYIWLFIYVIIPIVCGIILSNI